MKFTVDLENKKILIHDSFNRKQLDQLFLLLNIENMDEFVIDKYEEPINIYPNVHNNPIQPINPYYPDWSGIDPIQPYITYTNGTSDVNVDCNTQYTTSTLSELLSND